MGPVSLEVAWETTRVVSVESEIFSLKPNGVLTRSYPTADAQPYSFQATARGPVGFGATASVWLGGGPETFLGRFATRTLTDIRRLEATCIGRDPLPCLTTGYAYLLDPDIPSSIYDYIGGARARVWLFLHYSDDRFFIDAFVQGDRFSIPEDGVPHHGSCVEFGLSCSDRLGFEAVMSLTQNGPAIWQRGLDRHPQVPATKLLDRLRVEHRSKDHLVFYRLSLDWDWLSPGYSPKKGDIVKCAFVFLSGKGLGAGLFKGIQAGKEIARYGEIVLV